MPRALKVRFAPQSTATIQKITIFQWSIYYTLLQQETVGMNGSLPGWQNVMSMVSVQWGGGLSFLIIYRNDFNE